MSAVASEHLPGLVIHQSQDQQMLPSPAAHVQGQVCVFVIEDLECKEVRYQSQTHKETQYQARCF